MKEILVYKEKQQPDQMFSKIKHQKEVSNKGNSEAYGHKDIWTY